MRFQAQARQNPDEASASMRRSRGENKEVRVVRDTRVEKRELINPVS